MSLLLYTRITHSRQCCNLYEYSFDWTAPSSASFIGSVNQTRIQRPLINSERPTDALNYIIIILTTFSGADIYIYLYSKILVTRQNTRENA